MWKWTLILPSSSDLNRRASFIALWWCPLGCQCPMLLEIFKDDGALMAVCALILRSPGLGLGILQYLDDVIFAAPTARESLSAARPSCTCYCSAGCAGSYTQQRVAALSRRCRRCRPSAPGSTLRRRCARCPPRRCDASWTRLWPWLPGSGRIGPRLTRGGSLVGLVPIMIYRVPHQTAPV